MGSQRSDSKSTCIWKFLNIDRLIPFTGMWFFLMQVKTGLCHILSRFEVAPCKETPVPIGLDKKSDFLTTNWEVPLSLKRMQY